MVTGCCCQQSYTDPVLAEGDALQHFCGREGRLVLHESMHAASQATGGKGEQRQQLNEHAGASSGESIFRRKQVHPPYKRSGEADTGIASLAADTEERGQWRVTCLNNQGLQLWSEMSPTTGKNEWANESESKTNLCKLTADVSLAACSDHRGQAFRCYVFISVTQRQLNYLHLLSCWSTKQSGTMFEHQKQQSNTLSEAWTLQFCWQHKHSHTLCPGLYPFWALMKPGVSTDRKQTATKQWLPDETWQKCPVTAQGTRQRRVQTDLQTEQSLVRPVIADN